MEEKSSLKKISTYNIELRDESIEEDRAFIEKLGFELQTLGRKVTNAEIIAIEVQLNKLLNKARKKPDVSQALIKTIATAWSIAAELAELIDNDERKKSDFFLNLYNLGDKLEKLGPLLTTISIPIIQSLDVSNLWS